ncbi:MAG: exonuclease subunit SbcD [Clostridiales bacterium]|nr:exonuclease subunit SbcD [Clostridiales bacterium]
MKILHTADLHLGKKLGKAQRLDEQCEVIKELALLADTEDVDVILIAGDIFDAAVPPSDAERVFYRSALTLAERGRAVIMLAGNHDDERRLCAAKPLADLQGIVLAGELDYSGVGSETLSDPTPPPSLYGLFDAADYLQKQRIKVSGHFGGVTIEKADNPADKTNIALVPYPSEGRLKRWYDQDYNLSYADRVKLTLDKACEFFTRDAYNILCTHLFLSKEGSDALGGLVALPTSILPENCDYVALGHVHKRLKISKAPHAEYCGSPLQYAYDETRNKSVNIIDTVKHSVTQAVLSSGKKLTETTASNFDECMAKLDAYSADYVRIKYGGEPLGKDETIRIKTHPAFNDLIVTASLAGDKVPERRAHLDDDTIFEMYYKYRYGAEPSAKLKAAFSELIKEIKN